jgi:hypothetical protein
MLRPLLLCLAALSAAFASGPETVVVTLHARAGAEADLAKAIARHWSVAKQMKLVLEEPHLTLQGDEGGKTYFIEIFTWRDAAVPDSAPPEIRKIWDDLNALTESRGGHPGLEFAPVEIKSGKP